MSGQFNVHQALFGYREGHNLVAASVPLAPRIRQFLANVTDGSGPEGSEGFEAPYTGLPVPETDYYALFCTWPAPEMPRPGCVWSHLLLILLADLARITDLSGLRKLFLRPAVPPDLTAYEGPLRLPDTDVAPGLTHPDSQRRAALLLQTLYGHPGKGIIILDEKSWPWEVPVFGLWSQQWPRLRRSFAFSTGSLGDRRSAGVSFDLQIAPLSSKRLWGRGSLPTEVTEFPDTVPPTAMPPWARTALDDLAAGSVGPLRKFFFSYGSDVEMPRQAFARLTECFVGPGGAEEDDPIPRPADDPVPRLAQIAAAFPQATEAVSLKREQLADLTRAPEPGGLESLWAATFFLLRAQEASAFERVPIDLGPHAEQLWQHKRADVLDLLGSIPQSERGNDLLHALATVVKPEELPILWSEQGAMLPRFLAQQPSLAADAAAWAMPEAGQRALWESLHAATSDQHTWALTCGAMLEAQCAFAERETVTLAGPSLADGLTRWLQAEDIRLPSREWRRALRVPLASAMKDRDLPTTLLALAAWSMTPEEARSVPGSRADVQALVGHTASSIPKPLLLPTLFWLTALGVQTPDKNGLALLARAFFPVYDTVARSHYPGELWELLAPVLPEPTLGLGWDRCRLLRRALRRWLRDNPKLANSMVRAAPSDEHADLVRNLR
jgi:hypothetical protein